MNIKKLRMLFLLCLLAIIILIAVSSCNLREIFVKEEIVIPTDTNVEAVHKFEKIDYNNLTNIQRQYITEAYSNNVKFTEKGVEVYLENAYSGKLAKIITSTWPEDEMGNFIPKPLFGEIEKIEYAGNWINVYINNAKKSDVKDYLKELKKYDFTQNEEKDDGKALLRYKIYDELGNTVEIMYLKQTNEIEIIVSKAK